MFQINLQSDVPIYDQIVRSVIRLKSVGVLKAGDRLPSVRSTALSLGINPNTVQKAYNILEAKHITVSAAGRGSFIAESDTAEKEMKIMAENILSDAVKKAFSDGVQYEEAIEIIKEVYGGGAE